MRRIFINEQDLTTNGQELMDSSANAIYIPGFAGPGATAEVGVPQFVSSVSEFKKLFGDAPQFAIAQNYPKYQAQVKSGFPEVAIPSGYSGETDPGDIVWFKAQANCPSYVEALSLISQGLTICYERMNENDTFSFSFTSTYIEGSQTPGTQTWVTKEITGIIPDEKYAYYKQLAEAEEPTGIEASKKQEAIELLGQYSQALADYDVTVAKAYEYMINRAFNGSIEDKYDEETGELVSYGSRILNVGEYDVKYLTSGGYPSYEYMDKSGAVLTDLIINTAAATSDTTNWGRGDCVALIDHTDNPYRPLEGKKSVYRSALPNSSYATMFTPWCECTNGYIMPGSYVYLCTFANSLKNNPSWASVAGVSRGVASVVKSLHTNMPLTNRLAEAYQYGYQTDEDTQSINAITYIKNYGFCIWGNRTLLRYVVDTKGFALSFLNTRNLVSEVKKQIYQTSKKALFETNNEILWTKFQNAVTPTLDAMVAGYGLKKYSVSKVKSNDKTKLRAMVVLYPTYCVESVYVDVVLKDDDEIVVSDGE